MSSPNTQRRRRPEGAVRRRFELFALEAWEDSQGRILQVDHGTVALCHVDPDPTVELDAQRTFDEWVEDQLFWNHHLANAEAFEENDNEVPDSNQW